MTTKKTPAEQVPAAVEGGTGPDLAQAPTTLGQSPASQPHHQVVALGDQVEVNGRVWPLSKAIRLGLVPPQG